MFGKERCFPLRIGLANCGNNPSEQRCFNRPGCCLCFDCDGASCDDCKNDIENAIKEKQILLQALQAIATPLEYKAIMLEIKSLSQTNEED